MLQKLGYGGFRVAIILDTTRGHLLMERRQSTTFGHGHAEAKGRGFA